MKKQEERSPKVGETMQSSLWSIVSMSLIAEEKKASLYFELCKEKSEYEEEIERDTHRVLTKVSFNSGDGPFLLHRVLSAFTLHMPHLGFFSPFLLSSPLLFIPLY